MIEYTDCISTEGLDSSPNECPGYDIKKSDNDALALVELWRMRGTPSLPSLPGPLWARVETPVRVLSVSQIELFHFKTVCKQMTYVKLNGSKYNCFIM